MVVFLAAIAAAGATVGLTALTSDPEPGKPEAVCKNGPLLQLDLGVRSDPEAVTLRRAQSRLAAGDAAAAGRMFARFRSIDARVGEAVAAWPDDTLATLEALARRNPRNATVLLHLGSALFCRGQLGRARAEWRAAKRAAPDSLLAVRAADFLHPRYVPGIPVFVPSFGYPRRLARLSPAARLRELERSARRDVRSRVLYGVALQQLFRPVSAERQYEAAARLAPDDPEAQVAAALGRFDKDRPVAAFSRLGPLTRRFPRAPTVRFHLGLALLWLGQVDAGKAQLERARRLAPASPLGREAARFLARL